MVVTSPMNQNNMGCDYNLDALWLGIESQEPIKNKCLFQIQTNSVANISI